jgi:hypothetical protein
MLLLLLRQNLLDILTGEVYGFLRLDGMVYSSATTTKVPEIGTKRQFIMMLTAVISCHQLRI